MKDKEVSNPISESGAVTTARAVDDYHLLALLLENTSDSIYFKDLNSRFIKISRALARKLNLSHPDEAVGKTDADFFSPGHAADALSDEQNIMGTGFALIGKEEKETWPDGSEAWVMTNKMLLLDPAGHTAGTFGISHDITAIKNAEGALRAARRESDVVIDSVPSILIGVDRNGTVKRWNLAATETFGITEAEVQGSSLIDCGIRWTDPQIAEEISSWLHVKGAERRDSIAFQKGTEKRYLGLTLKRVDYSDAGGIELLIMGADTTERTQLELQLRQAQKLEAIGQLAAGVAHEINTPAQYLQDNTRFITDSWPTIRELLEIAREVGVESSSPAPSPTTAEKLSKVLGAADLEYLLTEIPRALEQSLDGIERIATIVRAMKEFSHPDSAEKQLVQVNRAIETAVTVSRSEWKYVADIEVDLEELLPPVHCFPGELNQVLINLMVNAAHAIGNVVSGGQRGKISISSRRAGTFIEVAIRDTGPGIPERIQSRVFEPFFTTKELGKGTGQGLAMAHGIIVKRHAGRIWFETQVGVGTTFFIRLPICP